MSTLELAAWIALGLLSFWGGCLTYVARYKHPEPPLPPGERTVTPNDWRGKP